MSTDYLSANEARNLCPPATSDEVFDNIKSKARFGGTDLVMRSALLLPETRDQLVQLGYTLTDDSGYEGDLTVIAW